MNMGEMLDLLREFKSKYGQTPTRVRVNEATWAVLVNSQLDQKFNDDAERLSDAVLLFGLNVIVDNGVDQPIFE